MAGGRSCSGQYASYLNAFLCRNELIPEFNNSMNRHIKEPNYVQFNLGCHYLLILIHQRSSKLTCSKQTISLPKCLKTHRLGTFV